MLDFKKTWFGTAVNNGKLLVGAVTTAGLMLSGLYFVASEHFVTKLYAEDLEKNYNIQINEMMEQTRELKQQTKSTSRMVVELQMIRLETKIGRDENLTPTEKRQYEHLKKQYDEF